MGMPYIPIKDTTFLINHGRVLKKTTTQVETAATLPRTHYRARDSQSERGLPSQVTETEIDLACPSANNEI